MQYSVLGMILAVGASFFWSASPIFFSSAGKISGAYSLNLLRLTLASILLWITVVLWFQFSGHICAFPGFRPVFWLSVSALAGLVIGDILYLKSLIFLGPRRTTQLLSLSPLTSITVAWFWFGEVLSPKMLIGSGLAVLGVLYTVVNEKNALGGFNREPGTFSLKGYLIGIAGVMGHGLGAVFARKAYLCVPDLDPILATTFRVSAAFILSSISIFFNRSFPSNAKREMLSSKFQIPLILGTLCGPVLGMICYVSAFKYAPAGIVSTLSGLSPVLIIPVVMIRYKTRINLRLILGPCLAVAGVIVMNTK